LDGSLYLGPATAMPAPPKATRFPRPKPVSAYDRLRDLPRLLLLWPEEVRRLGPGDQPRLVLKLTQMLRAERQLGLSRHWSYDLTRHAALLRAWRAEKLQLTVLATGRAVAAGRTTEHKASPR
jgi:hypothetical protein